MYVSNLVIEVTRRCNMRCDHCMRGSAQRMDMSYSTLWNALRDINDVSMLTLTGGEPSLKPEIAMNVWRIMISRKINLGSFYVVTNARSTYRRDDFLEALDHLYEWSEEKDMCALVVSQDQYHNALRYPNMKGFYEIKDPYSEYGYEREYFKPHERKENIIYTINEGRAVQTGVGTKPMKLQKPWKVARWDGELHVQENEIYIASNGNVTSCCDMSYRRIDKEAIGNINKEPLEEIVLRNCEWIEDDEQMTGEPTSEPVKEEV